MIRLRARRYGGQVRLRAWRVLSDSRGFSILELLIATTITALLAAAIAAVVPPLQAYFEQTPAAIDLHQRGRTALEVIAQAVRSADRLVVLDPGRLMTIARRVNAARGLLERDQADGEADLFLSDAGCPATADVCGFVRGATAVIDDASGRFDLFTVRFTDASARRMSASDGFDQPYAAQSSVVEVDAYVFRLDWQPDGSRTLVRETGAGAIQPIVDRVRALRFEEALGARGVDVTITLQPHGLPAPDMTRRMAIMARNVP